MISLHQPGFPFDDAHESVNVSTEPGGCLQSSALGGEDVWLTSPEKANLHRVEAVEDSLFFDLIAPPYDFPDLRPCTYYQIDEDKRLAHPVPQSSNFRVFPFKI